MTSITYNGKTLSAVEWAEELGVTKQYISSYFKRYSDAKPEQILAHIDKNNEFKLPRKKRCVSLGASEKQIYVSSETINTVYNFIYSYILTHQYAPAIREIAEGTSIKSTNTIGVAIRSLIDDGRLETDCGVQHSRAYRVAKFKLIEEE